MTMDGDTIAASNFDAPASFIGENFSYRPYFFEAAAGKQARFYALGTTSLKRGYYFSSPIEVDGVVRGVIAFKVDVEGSRRLGGVVNTRSSSTTLRASSSWPQIRNGCIPRSSLSLRSGWSGLRLPVAMPMRRCANCRSSAAHSATMC